MCVTRTSAALLILQGLSLFSLLSTRRSCTQLLCSQQRTKPTPPSSAAVLRVLHRLQQRFLSCNHPNPFSEALEQPHS